MYRFNQLRALLLSFVGLINDYICLLAACLVSSSTGITLQA